MNDMIVSPHVHNVVPQPHVHCSVDLHVRVVLVVAPMPSRLCAIPWHNVLMKVQ